MKEQDGIKWNIDNSFASKSKFKKVAKRHTAEFDACMGNLDKVRNQLLTGAKLGSFKLGFFRSEGDDLYRVGQTGVSSAKELRLYVYFYQSECGVIYPITIVTKETQQADIKEAKKTIKGIEGKHENDS